MKAPLFLVALLGVVLSACGPRVVTSRPNMADLSDYNTFAFLPNADIKSADEGQMSSDDLNRMSITAINDNMREAGYALDRDEPDLLVLASVKTDIETETTTDPVYARYGAYNTPGVGARVSPYYNNYYYNGYAGYDRVVGYDTDTYRYEEGTLVINVIDRETKETVWKGVSSTPVTGSTTETVVDLVDAIFEEYPLGAGEATSMR